MTSALLRLPSDRLQICDEISIRRAPVGIIFDVQLRRQMLTGRGL
jgi:hypothetical protein